MTSAVDTIVQGGTKGGAVAAEGAPSTIKDVMAGVRQVGLEGENAVRTVYDIGPATPIRLSDGTDRIADGLTPSVLSEVKNVESQSYTQQLRDFAQYASENGLRFDLYVKPTTQLSAPLKAAIDSGVINLKYIPTP